MSHEHPTYPNPTITEAVCDIHFRLLQGKEWKPSLPGELFKYIQNEYPEMEPVVEIGLQLERGPLGTGTKFAPQRQKVRFKHRTRPLVSHERSVYSTLLHRSRDGYISRKYRYESCLGADF